MSSLLASSPHQAPKTPVRFSHLRTRSSLLFLYRSSWSDCAAAKTPLKHTRSQGHNTRCTHLITCIHQTATLGNMRATLITVAAMAALSSSLASMPIPSPQVTLPGVSISVALFSAFTS